MRPGVCLILQPHFIPSWALSLSKRPRGITARPPFDKLKARLQQTAVVVLRAYPNNRSSILSSSKGFVVRPRRELSRTLSRTAQDDWLGGFRIGSKPRLCRFGSTARSSGQVQQKFDFDEQTVTMYNLLTHKRNTLRIRYLIAKGIRAGQAASFLRAGEHPGPAVRPSPAPKGGEKYRSKSPGHKPHRLFRRR